MQTRKKSESLVEYFQSTLENPFENNDPEHIQEVIKTVKEPLEQNNEDSPTLSDVLQLIATLPVKFRHSLSMMT
jgi:hypothetical protein